MLKDLEKKARAYAIKNAVAHSGKANSGAVISALFIEGLKKEEVKEIVPTINKIVQEINSINLEDLKVLFEKHREEISEREHREGLPELPNVPKTGVVMRFAPATSGPAHLGHILTGILSSLYIKKYSGKFYVRMEDTNPEKVFNECYQTFKEDFDWIFGNVTEYIIQSDRMKIYYKYAEKLIEKDSAYVCICSQEEFKKFAEKKKDCPCRKLNVKENIERWKKMLDKNGYGEGEAVLRFKTIEGMKHPNPAMRDFPLARINLHKHPRQDTKYRVWPLMNLSVTVDDIEYKMTHIIRAKEHMDNSKRQEMIYKVLGKKFPWTFFVGRIKFTDIPLSKRKMVAAIEAGEFEGWEDLRLPTIFSIRKRGYKPEAFAKFAEQRGLSDVDKVMSQKDLFDIIENFSKKL